MAFISPHKNLGGTEACGILVVRTSLVGTRPSYPGGGTVIYVKGYTQQDVFYDTDPFSR